MIRHLIAALFIFLAVQRSDSYDFETEEEDMVNLVIQQGYPLEVHEIVTEDGYILTAYRIPYGKNKTATKQTGGPPAILQHGILCSSAGWVLGNPKEALGFVLADGGYDVWITNSRGSTYSRKHKWLDTSSAEFWDFSFHEMGYYDLPATIDYILEAANVSKLFYVGHSQGTTQYWALASTRPEYNDKVRHVSALAPVSYLQQTRGAVHVLGKIASWLEKFASLFGMHHILDQSILLQIAERAVCRAGAITLALCDNILFLLGGYDSQELNLDLIPEVMKYTPAGASTKQLIHFGQLIHSGGRFTLFDYGSSENVLMYGQGDVPEYDLSKVTTPVMLHYAENDWVAGVEDVKKLYNELPNSKMKVVPFQYFNHLDFMWARDAYELCYKDVLDEMSKY